MVFKQTLAPLLKWVEGYLTSKRGLMGDTVVQ